MDDVNKLLASHDYCVMMAYILKLTINKQVTSDMQISFKNNFKILQN